jgi:hypothetical protein
MHKSKLAGFIIDCQTDDLNQAADFWGGALGMPVRELPADEAVLYKRLEDSRHGLNIEVPPRSGPERDVPPRITGTGGVIPGPRWRVIPSLIVAYVSQISDTFDIAQRWSKIAP